VAWGLGLRLSWRHGRSLPLPGVWWEGFALKGLLNAVLYK
jgi:hypothetical protein